MKKLLFVINTLGCGGAERALLELLATLDSRSYQISLYVLAGQGELIHQLPPEVTVLNEQYSDCSVLTAEGRRILAGCVLRSGVKRRIFVKRAGYLLKNLWKMGKEGRIQLDKLCWRILAEGIPVPEETYDLAVAFLEGGATYYVADRVKARRKAAFVHIDYDRAGYCRQLDLDCYQKIDHIFPVSHAVKTHFLETYPEYADKTSVFHNLVNPERIRSLSLTPGGFDDDFAGFRILTIGRLTEQKRYDVAIDTMALLARRSRRPVRWYVLGEGELRKQLSSRIRRMGLGQEFRLLGVKENPFPYLRQCDLYVHATGYEGKSIAIQEAQALGKPILATDCGGNREQIAQGVDGRLCPLEPNCICEEILWMMEHPDVCKAYGQRAQQKQLYSTEGLDTFLSLLDF